MIAIVLAMPGTSSKDGVLAVMCGVVAMTVIDLAVVNVALPSIQRELGVSAADLQYVVVAYGVFVAGFLMLGGRLGDLLGHRRMLTAGVVVLSGASLAGGLAQSLVVLVGARAVQGLGAAFAAPNAIAIVSSTFAEGAERNRALGIFGAAGGTAALVSSLIGGALVQFAGWEWVFFLNVPFGLVLMALVLTQVPDDRPDDVRGGSDVLGAATLTAGLMVIAFGVHESATEGWGSALALAPVLGGAALLGCFLLRERSARSPLIPLQTLRRPSLGLANVCAGFVWAAFLGFIYQVTLFLQEVQHWKPLASGAAGTPTAVLALVVSSFVAPRAMNRFGAARTLAGGLVALGAALALLAQTPKDMSYITDMVPGYLLLGVGIGASQVAAQIAAFAGIEKHETGLAGGANETSRELGGALGLALLVSIALSGATSQTDAFHRGTIGAACFALLGALVAGVPLWRAERAAQATPEPVAA